MKSYSLDKNYRNISKVRRTGNESRFPPEAWLLRKKREGKLEKEKQKLKAFGCVFPSQAAEMNLSIFI